MEFLSIFFTATGLATDCFAVSLSASASRRTYSFVQIFRTAAAFGAFQALMPALGWLAGRSVVELIKDYDHWIAFILLALVGGRMIWQSLSSGDGERENIDITRGFLLFTLAVATSIDALAVGLAFAFSGINILMATSTIGVVAFVATVIAFLLGGKAGKLMGRRAETVGGIVLIGIGVKILLEHLLAG